jgi:hypothetical protein
MNPSSWFDADADLSFQVLWEEGDRVFCRGRRRSTDGDRDTVLAVLLAAEHPTSTSLDRLAHEYGLRDELEGARGKCRSIRRICASDNQIKSLIAAPPRAAMNQLIVIPATGLIGPEPKESAVNNG